MATACCCLFGWPNGRRESGAKCLFYMALRLFCLFNITNNSKEPEGFAVGMRTLPWRMMVSTCVLIDPRSYPGSYTARQLSVKTQERRACVLGWEIEHVVLRGFFFWVWFGEGLQCCRKGTMSMPCGAVRMHIFMWFILKLILFKFQ